MAIVEGDLQHLHAAAASLRSVVSSTKGQSQAISNAASAAAGAAGNGAVEAAAQQCLGALAKAAGDTSLVVDHLGQVAQITADNFAKAGGGGS